MGPEQLPLFPEILSALVRRQELNTVQMRSVLQHLMSGSCPDAEAAAFLIALRMKGETANELAAAASVLREHMVRWDAGRPVLDTCGTGGDQSDTFNISTAAAMVVAAAGVHVVKHGNRSVSSRSGSADVLSALGIGLVADPLIARKLLDETHLAYCFAPHFHPALKHVASLRKRLGVPTLFNSLGPLANPAGARRQLLGVGRPELLDLLAEALAQLGTERALVVRGDDGLDEVSLSGPTQVREVQGQQITRREWVPSDFSLAECSLSELKVTGPEASAALILEVFQGGEGPATRIIVANAAAGLLAAGAVASLKDGVERAKGALREGKALNVVEALRKLSPG